MQAWCIKGLVQIVIDQLRNFANRLHCFFFYVCFMRSIAVILSMFILGLSMVPCADSVGNDDSILVSASQANHDHEADFDLCSPFCLCQCCQSHFTTYFSFYANLVVFPQTILETGYSDQMTDGFQMSVLQPPKV